MNNPDEYARLIADETRGRMTSITREGNLLVELYAKQANDARSAVEISEECLKGKEIQRLVKDKRIKVIKKGKKHLVHFIKLGKLVAMGEIALRMRDRNNSGRKEENRRFVIS